MRAIGSFVLSSYNVGGKGLVFDIIGLYFDIFQNMKKTYKKKKVFLLKSI